MKATTSRFWWGLLVGVVICIAIAIALPWSLAASGAISVSTRGQWAIIDPFFDYASMNSIAAHAPDKKNPFGDSPDAIEVGMDHYKENCLVCHGAPGVDASELAQGLNPKPPDLSSDDTQSMTDGQLFWTISHGIRMSGMPGFAPTHTVDERWKLVSFLRDLPKLTDAEKARLKAGRDEQAHHHHEGESAGDHGH